MLSILLVHQFNGYFDGVWEPSPPYPTAKICMFQCHAVIMHMKWSLSYYF